MSFRFIAGSDDFLVQRKAREEWEAIASRLGNPDALEIIDGQAGNVDEVARAVNDFVTAVRTVSMFAPEKAVWFKNISFLADTVTGRAAGTAEHIEHLQAVLGETDPASVQVLLSAAPVDRRKRAYKWFQTQGDSLFIEAGKDNSALLEVIQDEAKACGARFNPRAAAVLAQLVSGDVRLALEETRKLATYLHDGESREISPELVVEMVPTLGDSDFFEAAEAFYSLDLQWTLKAIHRHFFAGHDARPLIVTLQNRNRLLIQLKSLQAAGFIRGKASKAALEKAAAQHAGFFGPDPAKSSFCLFTQNPWYLGNLSENLDRLNLKTLLDWQEALRGLFLEIVARPNEQESVVCAFAVRCLSALQVRTA